MNIILNILFLFFVTANCFAGPIDVGNKKIIFPDIDGYGSINKNTQQFAFMESATQESRRLIYFYAPLPIASQINNGQVFDLKDYIICKTFCPTEYQSISNTEFQELAKHLVESMKQSVEIVDFDEAMKDITDRLKKQQNLDVDFKIDEPKLIGKPSLKDNIASFSMLIKFEAGEGKDKISALMIVKNYTLLVSGKIIYIYIYRDFHNESDVVKVNSIGEMLIAKLKLENS